MQNKMWMVGMMLVAFFVGLMFSQNTTAQQSAIGRYQIVSPADASGAFAWRVDTVTGRVSRCQTGSSSQAYDGCIVQNEGMVGAE